MIVGAIALNDRIATVAGVSCSINASTRHRNTRRSPAGLRAQKWALWTLLYQSASRVARAYRTAMPCLCSNSSPALVLRPVEAPPILATGSAFVPGFVTAVRHSQSQTWVPRCPRKPGGYRSLAAKLSLTQRSTLINPVTSSSGPKCDPKISLLVLKI